MAYTRPGVYVTESPLKTTVARNTGTSTAAFVGTSLRGPSTPTLINSWSGYTSQFGDLSQDYDLGYAVYQYFANGGRNCYVTRAYVATGASVALAATGASVMNYTASTAASTPAVLFNVQATSVGAHGNNISVTPTTGQVTLVAPTIGGTSGTLPTFNLSVTYNGTEVEYWSELSPDPASNRYATTIVNNYSSYITITNLASVVPAAGFTLINAGTAKPLTGGYDGSGAASATFITALDKLVTLPESLIVNAVGQSDSVIVAKVLEVCANRGDCFAIIDPKVSDTTAGLAITTASGYSTNQGYGAVYWPMLKMADPTKSGVGAIRDTFPGGAIAGIYARLETERTVAKPPAGYNIDIRNALGVTSTYTQTEVGTMYEAGINTFKAIPGAGVVVQGARTLNKIRPDKYISVRRSLNYVKSTSKFLTEFAVFEPNDERLWSSISLKLEKFLSDFWGSGGLRGRTPSEAFYVVCNSTNNTQTSIDDGEVNIEIGVSLLYPAEFIIINVSQWLGGSTTAENI
jgi:phage tail sheath protein FI